MRRCRCVCRRHVAVSGWEAALTPPPPVSFQTLHYAHRLASARGSVGLSSLRPDKALAKRAIEAPARMLETIGRLGDTFAITLNDPKQRLVRLTAFLTDRLPPGHGPVVLRLPPPDATPLPTAASVGLQYHQAAAAAAHQRAAAAAHEAGRADAEAKHAVRDAAVPPRANTAPAPVVPVPAPVQREVVPAPRQQAAWRRHDGHNSGRPAAVVVVTNASTCTDSDMDTPSAAVMARLSALAAENAQMSLQLNHLRVDVDASASREGELRRKLGILRGELHEATEAANGAALARIQAVQLEKVAAAACAERDALRNELRFGQADPLLAPERHAAPGGGAMVAVVSRPHPQQPRHVGYTNALIQKTSDTLHNAEGLAELALAWSLWLDAIEESL